MSSMTTKSVIYGVIDLRKKFNGSKKGKKGKKKCFVSWEVYFSSCYFFITPFPLHFKYDF
jgi:hypothetical protein